MTSVVSINCHVAHLAGHSSWMAGYGPLWSWHQGWLRHLVSLLYLAKEDGVGEVRKVAAGGWHLAGWQVIRWQVVGSQVIGWQVIGWTLSR